MKNISIFILVALLNMSFFNVFGDNDNHTANAEAKEKSSTAFVLNGQVVDELTGETLAGVSVFIEEFDLNVFTDFDGNFSIPIQDVSEISIRASFISYESLLLQNINVAEPIVLHLRQ